MWLFIFLYVWLAFVVFATGFTVFELVREKKTGNKKYQNLMYNLWLYVAVSALLAFFMYFLAVFISLYKFKLM